MTIAQAAMSKSQHIPVPDEVLELLESFRRPVVVGHVVPDADCLASMYSVATVWSDDGRAPRISLPPGCVSQRLGFLADGLDLHVASPEDFAAADGFVFVDTAKKNRGNVGKIVADGWSDGRPILNVDHHASNQQFGQVNWVVPEASSTAELVYAIIRAAGRDISPTLASLLYAGIHSDTSGFSLPNTSASSLRAGADLVACGAKVGELGERLCRSATASEFKLLRVIYANTKLTDDGLIAYSHADHNDIHGAGCTAADIDSQVDVPRSLSGIQMAILFTEGNEGKIRMNFRGEGGFTVLDLAKELGGGGHELAAGAVLHGTIDSVIAKVLPLAADRVRAFRAEQSAPDRAR